MTSHGPIGESDARQERSRHEWTASPAQQAEIWEGDEGDCADGGEWSRAGGAVTEHSAAAEALEPQFLEGDNFTTLLVIVILNDLQIAPPHVPNRLRSHSQGVRPKGRASPCMHWCTSNYNLPSSTANVAVGSSKANVAVGSSKAIIKGMALDSFSALHACISLWAPPSLPSCLPTSMVEGHAVKWMREGGRERGRVVREWNGVCEMVALDPSPRVDGPRKRCGWHTPCCKRSIAQE